MQPSVFRINRFAHRISLAWNQAFRNVKLFVNVTQVMKLLKILVVEEPNCFDITVASEHDEDSDIKCK